MINYNPSSAVIIANQHHRGENKEYENTQLSVSEQTETASQDTTTLFSHL